MISGLRESPTAKKSFNPLILRIPVQTIPRIEPVAFKSPLLKRATSGIVRVTTIRFQEEKAWRAR